MTYTWKPTAEIIWGVLVAVVTSLAISMQAGDPTVLANPATWITGAIAAAVRAGLGALLSVLGTQGGSS